MSETNGSEKGSENEERLRQELRNLPRVKAPWFFESELQQRLHHPASKGGLAARPILATAATLCVLAIAGSVTYYVYFWPVGQGTETAPDAGTPVMNAPAPQQQSPQSSGAEHQEVLLPTEGAPVSTGPSEPVNGISTGRHPAPVRTEQRPAQIPAMMPSAQGEAAHDSAPETVATPPPVRSQPRTTDTLRARADSAARQRDSLRVSAPDTVRRPR